MFFWLLITIYANKQTNTHNNHNLLDCSLFFVCKVRAERRLRQAPAPRPRGDRGTSGGLTFLLAARAPAASAAPSLLSAPAARIIDGGAIRALPAGDHWGGALGSMDKTGAAPSSGVDLPRHELLN